MIDIVDFIKYTIVNNMKIQVAQVNSNVRS